MRLLDRVEKLAARVTPSCPCRELRLIEIVEVAGPAPSQSRGCVLCGSSLPVSRIKVVKPEGVKP